MDRVVEPISSIMRREAELFVLLLSNKLNKFTEAHVEKKVAETATLKDTPTIRDNRGGKVISF